VIWQEVIELDGVQQVREAKAEYTSSRRGHIPLVEYYGTAVHGAVRTVVWEGESAMALPTRSPRIPNTTDPAIYLSTESENFIRHEQANIRPMQKTHKLITIKELGQILRLGRTALYAAKRRGDLPPAIRIGRNIRWDPSTVKTWLKEKECDERRKK